ncbi:MAG: DUF370 domain-containing protein [Candidatus Tectomicrobia bacterium]|uniref:Putative regulatory protein HY730_00675 n=1 Tax=Tectimicrobiota bacterium TaxID=2528274 RepID=A0A933GLB1_UNCTE|nr:DUF370 domain-containing protein [Candidatus Tectomicrobia bacterium]
MKKSHRPSFINIGFGNVIASSRIIAILNPGASPMKRLKEEARKNNKLVDATQGRKTRAIVVTDSDHIILSAIMPETMTQRLEEADLPSDSIK